MGKRVVFNPEGTTCGLDPTIIARQNPGRTDLTVVNTSGGAIYLWPRSAAKPETYALYLAPGGFIELNSPEDEDTVVAEWVAVPINLNVPKGYTSIEVIRTETVK